MKHDDVEYEPFELELLGGAVERRFRAERPYTEALPWGSLDTNAWSAAEILAARQSWTDLALQEYAAAASQANALRLCVRARAPVDLCAMLAGFPLDELAHTEICARMADELGGNTPLEYPTETVFPSPAPATGSPLLQAAKAVAWEFCVGETLSVGVLMVHRRHAESALLQEVWGRLARDEAAHARFGWTFMEWALPALTADERHEVATTVHRAVRHVDTLDSKVLTLPDETFTALSTYGAAGKEVYVAMQRRILETKVVPRLRALAMVPVGADR